ncbi:MAG TPA: hypothetical protein VMB26_10295 [Candidatus Binataceae bacterium]|nr:hypothetical protein [Candidatus Binataceae bacterium]
MLERWLSQYSIAVRLLLAATFLILGLVYLRFGFWGHGAVEPVQASTDYEISAPSTDRAAGGASKIDQPVSFDSSALSQQRSTRPAQRSVAVRSSDDRSGRLQAFTMFAALLMQYQSAGTGGK